MPEETKNILDFEQYKIIHEWLDPIPLLIEIYRFPNGKEQTLIFTDEIIRKESEDYCFKILKKVYECKIIKILL